MLNHHSTFWHMLQFLAPRSYTQHRFAWSKKVLLIYYFEKNMCLWNMNSPIGNKYQSGYFCIKVTVKVTKSLTLVSIERESLVEYTCQIWSLYLLSLMVQKLRQSWTFSYVGQRSYFKVTRSNRFAWWQRPHRKDCTHEIWKLLYTSNG